MATDVRDGPDLIQVTSEVRLRPFDPQVIRRDRVQELLPCYQDRETVRLVDGPNAEPYDLDKLMAMFQYMSEHGELYLIERLAPGRGWIATGDAGLQTRATPVVLSPEHRGQGIGRAVVRALIERARDLGRQSVEVSEIYDYNVASRRTYETLGFAVVGDTELGHRYRLVLS
ncbi:MAG TPA: GNAT family N-acetyltransferase [Microlunatus sp.]